MAKADKKEAATAPAASSSRGGLCLAEGCGKGSERAEFCGLHFQWFKLGLITRTGARAKDFDKKFQQHTRTATP
ncbi:MAG: hypothetical protein ABL958_02230 [Bdellovibrionia bacterium]